jgi:hypothetical protein
MRARVLASVLLGVTTIVMSASAVPAQNNPIITVNENGVGTIQFPGGPATPLPGALAPDPGPGGSQSALTYNLLGPPALVAGDLHIFEPGTQVLSDLIRFNPAGTGGSPHTRRRSCSIRRSTEHPTPLPTDCSRPDPTSTSSR